MIRRNAKDEYRIVSHPESVLRRKAKTVTEVTDEIRGIMASMINTMRASHGIGLAAPQVGISLRLAVMDTGDGPIKMINPIVIKKSGRHTMDEGCLSVTNRSVRVIRAEKVTVEYTDEWGKRTRKDFEGLAAKAAQHEIDHLNGRLIIDYMPWYRRVIS